MGGICSAWSMTNENDNKIDNDFIIDGQVFTKSLYLIDGICPCLMQFLRTAPGPKTMLENSFAINQLSLGKDVEQDFVVLKLKLPNQPSMPR